MMGDASDRYVFSTSSGYGFLTDLESQVSRNKAGKAVITVPSGASVLPAMRVHSDEDLVAAISNTGSMLTFPVNELPALSRGKGNRIFGITSKNFNAGTEFMTALAVVPKGGKLRIDSGKRHTMIKFSELENYLGTRGQRGRKLPRGFQTVNSVLVE